MTVANLPPPQPLTRPDGVGTLETLVHQHADFVYAAALRQVRDAHLAADVTQAVFLILQKKLSTLGPDTLITAWLIRTTRYTCLAALYRQRRRKHHEQKAAAMRSEIQTDPVPDEWPHFMDAALLKLADADRTALAGVYFEGLSHGELARRLGISEQAAHKRVQRAVEKLRMHFAGGGRRGMSAAAIAGALGAVAHPAAAPASVIPAVTASVGGTAPASVTTLVKGTTLIMKLIHAKLLGIAIAVGTVGVFGGAAAYQLAGAQQPPAAGPPATTVTTMEGVPTAVASQGAFVATRPVTLQQRYIRMFDQLKEKAALEEALSFRQRGGEDNLRLANAPWGAERGGVDDATLLAHAAAVQALAKENQNDFLAHSQAYTVYLWNKLEAATRVVRAKHGLPADLPAGLLEIQVGSDQRATAQAINAHMVLDLDDALEKEIVELLNEQYAKEKPSPDAIPIPDLSGKSNAVPSTQPAAERLP